MQQNLQSRQSLLTRYSTPQQPKPPHTPIKIGKDKLALFTIIAILLLLMVVRLATDTPESKKVVPERVAIPWFEDRDIVMELGTGRVVEALLYSGHDMRNFINFRQVTEREVRWSVEPGGIVSVDMYGTVRAIKEGECVLTLTSVANEAATDQRRIKVIRKRTDIDHVPKRVIKFHGPAGQTVFNYQKIVQRYTKQQVRVNPNIPQSVKVASFNPVGTFQTKVIEGDFTWTVQNFTDGTPKRYVKRVNAKLDVKNRDKVQYFIGDRYLPDQGVKPIMIETNGNKGLWVVGQTGNVNHIKMVIMKYSEKAQMMTLQTEKNVMRNGLASGANWDGQKWIPQISDNDGLWTSMYGAGQLMRYAVLKQRGENQSVIAIARQRALKPLKAVLLTANVAGREGKVKAKIRHLNNTRSGDGVFYSKKYLLQGKPDLRDTYVGRPGDGVSFFGVDAGKNVQGDSFAGTFKYSLLPIRPQDWALDGIPALTQRSLEGFMSRTFVIPAVDPPVPKGGLFFKRTVSSSHQVLSGAHTLYDYTDNDHPSLELGNKPIPEVLKSLLLINGTQYNASDIVYKGDTSTDQVIGHLFIYKIAYDILDDKDTQQNQLKQLIRQTMRNFCQHLINNGYRMVDATGQSTKWTKLYKQFYTTDYTIEDGILKSLQLLMSFKLAYYVTGERKWKDQYDLFMNDQKFRYVDFVGKMWDRWVYAFTRCDDKGAKMEKLDYADNPSQVQIERHVLYQTHFSDQQQAYLAFYLTMQLQQDHQIRQKYIQSMNGYWHSISKSQNPLWYYIYQLGYPQKAMNDSYGNDLRATASWQLSRHMIQTRQYQAYIHGSRSDVLFQGPISVNPTKVIGSRTSRSDRKYVNQTISYKIFKQFNPRNIYEVKVLPADERSIHKFNGATFQNIDGSHNPLNMQPSTTYTLPYWLGVYHGLIKYD